MPVDSTIVNATMIADAEGRIRPYIVETPLLPSPAFSKMTGANVFLKLENRQFTGSFKVRGALNKILGLDPADQRTIVTASTGNHGLGVGYAMRIPGRSGTIVVPQQASGKKLGTMRSGPADIVRHGSDSLEAELHAKAMAKEQDAIWISPYNDPAIIAGQGTVGYELTRQLDPITAVYVTVGGGGLISGIATWFAAKAPGTEVIACLPENSPEMKLSVEAGRVIHLEHPKPTLSDGSAGGLEDGSITFPICLTLVQRYLLVTEAEIADAIRLVHSVHAQRIEGSAGVAVAAMMKDAERYRGQNVVTVICGGNIDDHLFEAIRAGG